MSRFEHTILIERPPEAVFAFIHDFEKIGRWQPHVLESKQPEHLGVGTELQQTRQFFGQRIESTFRITAYEPPRTSSFETTSGEVPMNGTYTLEPLDGGTKLTWRGEIHEGGVLRLAEPVFARMAQRELETSFSHLKDLLELES